MSCLVLRLAGPLQSWGTQSRFFERDTGYEPSKSGVIGMICTALGIDREDDDAILPLVSMEMGIRADREGIILRDYHTSGGGQFRGNPYGVKKASGSKRETVLSNRYYLADAEFMVVLRSEYSLLKKISDAFFNPRWNIYLGRKSCLPEFPLCLGIVENDSVASVLENLPWRKRKDWETPPESLRIVLESNLSSDAIRNDIPLSFGLHRRQYSVRYVKTAYCKPTRIVQSFEELLSCISPD